MLWGIENYNRSQDKKRKDGSLKYTSSIPTQYTHPHEKIGIIYKDKKQKRNFKCKLIKNTTKMKKEQLHNATPAF